MKRITVKNVKNITKLEFEIPNAGVYVLTGANGSGKTTLLTALYRIGFGNAFANAFKTTPNEDKMDFFGESSIEYEIDHKKVSYKYGNTRWSPTPKTNSKILKDFGYPAVKFIAADAKRIEATEDDLKLAKIKPADTETCQKIQHILSDSKFSDLHYVNTRRGTGSKAYLIQKKIKNRNHYFSEKNFSLGELCVLRLVTGLSVIENQSLVLIDEIEMALHPKAQVALWDYLVEVAKEKQLTVIFSTHSASLIKRAPRKQILLLQNENDKVTCIQDVYPAQVLGEIAFDDEINPDFLFFVEDDKAKFLLEHMINKYFRIALNPINPVYKIVPVGGFPQTIEFLLNSSQIFNNEVQRLAFLDKDVEDESMVKYEKNQNYDFLKKIKSCKNKLKYLPCTPEQGIVGLIEEDINFHAKEIKKNLKTQVDLLRVISECDYKSLNNSNDRKLAKKKLDFIVNQVRQDTGWSDEECVKKLASYYVESYYSGTARESELKSVFAPIFNS